jgi:glycosyltransferase involved in cell wall biosynthesis
MKVSILVMTYNHANFIAQALESVLMQRVNFAYEILISEDCSTDGTREIVVEFQKRYPDKIRLLLSEQNVHSNAVVVRGIQHAKGQYIALLDGDDYWTSAHKLQKQVDFLDTHPECAVCFHNAAVIHEDGSRPPHNWTPADQKEVSTLEDIWLGNFIATCSTMFRRGLFGQIPDWYDALFPITDWPLHILNAEHGMIGYLNEVMGVYRHHSGGLYSPFSEARKLEETLKFYKVMNRNLNYKYDRLIHIAISKYFFEWAEEYVSRGDLERAKVCFKRCLSGRPVNKFVSLKQLLVLGLRLYKLSLLSLKKPVVSRE